MLIKTDEKKGLLSDLNISLIRNKDWRIISKYSPSLGKSILHVEKAFEGSLYTDYSLFIETFLNPLYDREFKSILCGGLGLGVVPYLCQTFCDVVDVVEIDQDNIDLIKTAGYLSDKVNIICRNLLEYIPEKPYDVILLDIWQNTKGEYSTQKEILKANLTPYLNSNGLLCVPLEDY